MQRLIIRQPKSPKRNVLVLITGIERLDKEEHDRLREKILKEFPYDYAVANIEKPHYKELNKPNPSIIQIYKLWDMLKELPDHYTHIIRVRNDIEMWEKGDAGKMTDFVKFWLKSDYTVGIGPLGASKLCKNFRNNKTVFMGDHITMFRRTSMINPYTIKNMFEQRKTVHDCWTLCFENNVFHYNMPIKLVRKKYK